MKVFISWSGRRSKAVAEYLSDWLKCVIQSLQPWISTRDIDRGALWFNKITEQLGQTSIGIICLTGENKTQPWILFEAGALAKGLSQNRVCTLLVDLEPKDIEAPLSQFNHTVPTKEGMRSLVATLNAAQEQGLEEKVLNEAFETYWPKFQAQVEIILQNTEGVVPQEPRQAESILSEILDLTRGLSARVSSLEDNLPSRHLDTLQRYLSSRDAALNSILDPDAPSTSSSATPKSWGLGLGKPVTIPPSRIVAKNGIKGGLAAAAAGESASVAPNARDKKPPG